MYGRGRNKTVLTALKIAVLPPMPNARVNTATAVRSGIPRFDAGCPSNRQSVQPWILGTHQGSVSAEHLQSYLEEFTFRFNRRTSRSRGLVFRRLIKQAVVTGPVTEAALIHGYHW